MSNSTKILDFKEQLELQDSAFPTLQILDEKEKSLTKKALNVPIFQIKI